MRQLKWCSQCTKKSIFQQHNRGWCSTVAMMGMNNHFGHCKTNAIDSPELTAYESKFKGEL